MKKYMAPAAELVSLEMTALIMVSGGEEEEEESCNEMGDFL